MVTPTPHDNGMQKAPTSRAPRNSTVLAHGADQSRSVRYDDLADRLATHGPSPLHGELRDLIRDARRRGVTPLLVTILADPTQPDVARQRAFGRILAELARPRDVAPTARSANDAA